MSTLLRIAVLFSLFFFSLFSPASAKDFSTRLRSVYTIDEKGKTSVSQEFVVTNQTSVSYMTDYAFEAPGTHIEHVVAESNGKKLTLSQSSLENKSSIALVFPDKVVGKGQERSFTVTYTSQDIGAIAGKVLEVSIPKLTDPAVFDAYTVVLRVPSSFGPPTRSSPKQFVTSSDGKITTYTFTDFSKTSAVSVVFGKEQLARLALSYHIRNVTGKRGQTHIALPSDGMFQRIWYDTITPKPLRIEQDRDGNWLGVYDLDANQSLDISAIAYVRTQPTPRDDAELLTPPPTRLYTSKAPFWPVADPLIRPLTTSLHTSEDVYHFVLDHIRYGERSGSADSRRLGADGVLRDPTSATCQEFTDLFVTLARTIGIPARAVVGYAYTQNPRLRPIGIGTDILHSWPEYFDDVTSTWVAVDPTWEQTTGGVDYFHSIDFNRIAFVTQGMSSENPIPVGMYKKDTDASKDVVVEYVSAIPELTPEFSTEIIIHPRALLGIGETYAVRVHNTTLGAWYAVPIKVSVSQGSGTSTERTEKLSFLPDQDREIPVQLRGIHLFSPTRTTVRVTIGGKTYTHELTATTTIRQLFPLILLTMVVGGSIAISAIITRRLLVPRWKR